MFRKYEKREKTYNDSQLLTVICQKYFILKYVDCKSAACSQILGKTHTDARLVVNLTQTPDDTLEDKRGDRIQKLLIKLQKVP